MLRIFILKNLTNLKTCWSYFSPSNTAFSLEKTSTDRLLHKHRNPYRTSICISVYFSVYVLYSEIVSYKLSNLIAFGEFPSFLTQLTKYCNNLPKIHVFRVIFSTFFSEHFFSNLTRNLNRNYRNSFRKNFRIYPPSEEFPSFLLN